MFVTTVGQLLLVKQPVMGAPAFPSHQVSMRKCFLKHYRFRFPSYNPLHKGGRS